MALNFPNLSKKSLQYVSTKQNAAISATKQTKFMVASTQVLGIDDPLYKADRELWKLVPRGRSIVYCVPNDADTGKPDDLTYLREHSPIASIQGVRKFGYQENEFGNVDAVTHVWAMEKENGENFQVSAFMHESSKFWLVGSKNVHMVLRYECPLKDLEAPCYNTDRYRAAKTMARVWFESPVTDPPSEDVAALRERCFNFLASTRYSFIGEAILRTSQHFVNYATKQQQDNARSVLDTVDHIRFFAITAYGVRATELPLRTSPEKPPRNTVVFFPYSVPDMIAQLKSLGLTTPIVEGPFPFPSNELFAFRTAATSRLNTEGVILYGAAGPMPSSAPNAEVPMTESQERTKRMGAEANVDVDDGMSFDNKMDLSSPIAGDKDSDIGQKGSPSAFDSDYQEPGPVFKEGESPSQTSDNSIPNTTATKETVSKGEKRSCVLETSGQYPIPLNPVIFMKKEKSVNYVLERSLREGVFQFLSTKALETKVRKSAEQNFPVEQNRRYLVHLYKDHLQGLDEFFALEQRAVNDWLTNTLPRLLKFANWLQVTKMTSLKALIETRNNDSYSQATNATSTKRQKTEDTNASPSYVVPTSPTPQAPSGGSARFSDFPSFLNPLFPDIPTTVRDIQWYFSRQWLSLQEEFAPLESAYRIEITQVKPLLSVASYALPLSGKSTMFRALHTLLYRRGYPVKWTNQDEVTASRSSAGKIFLSGLSEVAKQAPSICDQAGLPLVLLIDRSNVIERNRKDTLDALDATALDLIVRWGHPDDAPGAWDHAKEECLRRFVARNNGHRSLSVASLIKEAKPEKNKQKQQHKQHQKGQQKGTIQQYQEEISLGSQSQSTVQTFGSMDDLGMPSTVQTWTPAPRKPLKADCPVFVPDPDFVIPESLTQLATVQPEQVSTEQGVKPEDGVETEETGKQMTFENPGTSNIEDIAAAQGIPHYVLANAKGVVNQMARMSSMIAPGVVSNFLCDVSMLDPAEKSTLEVANQIIVMLNAWLDEHSTVSEMLYPGKSRMPISRLPPATQDEVLAALHVSLQFEEVLREQHEKSIKHPHYFSAVVDNRESYSSNALQNLQRSFQVYQRSQGIGDVTAIAQLHCTLHYVHMNCYHQLIPELYVHLSRNRDKSVFLLVQGIAWCDKVAVLRVRIVSTNPKLRTTNQRSHITLCVSSNASAVYSNTLLQNISKYVPDLDKEPAILSAYVTREGEKHSHSDISSGSTENRTPTELERQILTVLQKLNKEIDEEVSGENTTHGLDEVDGTVEEDVIHSAEDEILEAEMSPSLTFTSEPGPCETMKVDSGVSAEQNLENDAEMTHIGSDSNKMNEDKEASPMEFFPIEENVTISTTYDAVNVKEWNRINSIFSKVLDEAETYAVNSNKAKIESTIDENKRPEETMYWLPFTEENVGSKPVLLLARICSFP